MDENGTLTISLGDAAPLPPTPSQSFVSHPSDLNLPQPSSAPSLPFAPATVSRAPAAQQSEQSASAQSQPAPVAAAGPSLALPRGVTLLAQSQTSATGNPLEPQVFQFAVNVPLGSDPSQFLRSALPGLAHITHTMSVQSVPASAQQQADAESVDQQQPSAMQTEEDDEEADEGDEGDEDGAVECVVM